MAGDGLTDDQAKEFWAIHRKFFESTFPKAIKEICEVALLGGALLVAHRFSESTILLALYWALLAGFGFRIGARIAFPKEYDSPSLPIILGLLVTIVVTGAEDRAIRSAATAALIQVQSEKAGKLLAAQAKREKEAARLSKAWVDNWCFDDERYAAGKYNYALCNRLSVQRAMNKRSTDELLKP